MTANHIVKEIDNKKLEFTPKIPEDACIVSLATKECSKSNLENQLGGDLIKIGTERFFKKEGFTLKVRELKKFLSACEEDKIVIFLDYSDTYICRDVFEMTNKYKNNFDGKLIISTELNHFCFFKKHLVGKFLHDVNKNKEFYDHLNPQSRFRYINSGAFIGRAKVFKELLLQVDELSVKYPNNDQGLWAIFYEKTYENFSDKIHLDTKCEFFQSFSSIYNKDKIIEIKYE